MLRALQLILALNKGWSSKTLIFARLLAFLPAIDAGFFQSKVGAAILNACLLAVHWVPFLMGVTSAQMVSVLLVVIGGFVAWLRSRTTVPIEAKI